MSDNWRPSLGATIAREGTTFRVWAPRPVSIELVVERSGVQERFVCERDSQGYATAYAAAAGHGTRYGYIVDGQGPFPDPCSRSQPDGVHGMSEVIDPSRFPWTDHQWVAPAFRELVVYECHPGTFSSSGDFAGIEQRLSYLRELGIKALELTPVNSFPGRWNWGYDGVALFAPQAGYGGPDGLKRFIDAAHATGLAVILDVVYNHFGPDGNYTGLYSEHYLTNRRDVPWGDAINTDGPGSAHVRRFFRENLLHWLHEYHVDGFRFDATHTIVDDSERHILGELTDTVRGSPRSGHTAYLIAETPENDHIYLRPTVEGGFGFDGVWADDFHHAAHVTLLDERHSYLNKYSGDLSELAATIENGFLFRGPGGEEVLRTADPEEGRRFPWSVYVTCLQNHDQVAIRSHGLRLHSGAALGDVYAATMLLLCLPHTPLLFQGQEFLASSPFLYFTDHREPLGSAVTGGRRRDFRPEMGLDAASLAQIVPDPQASSTFEQSKLRWQETEGGPGAAALRYHRDLLRLRVTDQVLADFRRERLAIETDVVGRAMAVYLRSPSGMRTIVVNFGERATLPLNSSGEFRIVLHSNEAQFAGPDRRAPRPGAGRIELPPHCAAFIERVRD